MDSSTIVDAIAHNGRAAMVAGAGHGVKGTSSAGKTDKCTAKATKTKDAKAARESSPPRGVYADENSSTNPTLTAKGFTADEYVDTRKDPTGEKRDLGLDAPLWLGYSALLPVAPYVALQIVMCTAWEFIDEHSINLIKKVEALSAKISPNFRRFVRHPDDGFMMTLLIWLGVVLPAYFFYELHHALVYGFDWRRVLVYNLVRIGPMYKHFMYVYVMCHKEGHSIVGLFAQPYHMGLQRVFNLWVGMFHGVVPGTFMYSHTYNHHRYDNTQRDDITCGDRARDNWNNYVRYIPRWFAYATNVATIRRFLLKPDEKGELRVTLGLKTVAGTLYYMLFLAFFFRLQPAFAAATLLYPLIEANILLSIVNFVWHAFTDPADPTNDYVVSTTIIDGLNFTLKEEYHVVHHQYAGVHWTKHPELFEKHKAEYAKAKGTIFYKKNLFEIFGMIVSKDYDQLASCYYGEYVGLKMEKKEIAAMLKERLQYTGSWADNEEQRKVGPMFMDRKWC
eukprot:TRINITY_DN31973_c0_g1_i1.p2 TRINITY_DN31973_c0_g1~~TRINITY_DN31973_c0_g1_i1.p2  ORF type:complete len:506 (-),score=104.60 TRINITY_DN31973_c0_g1_i1:149-1666(-)